MTQYWGTGRLGTVQSAAYTGTAGTTTNGVANGVQKVRVLVTTDAYVRIGVNPTATTSDTYVVGLSPEYFTVMSGEKVSAVQVSSGGTLVVTEIS